MKIICIIKINENLTASDNLQFKFGKDGDGNYGYYGADGSLIPFKSGGQDIVVNSTVSSDKYRTISISAIEDVYITLIGIAGGSAGYSTSWSASISGGTELNTITMGFVDNGHTYACAGFGKLNKGETVSMTIRGYYAGRNYILLTADDESKLTYSISETT